MRHKKSCWGAFSLLLQVMALENGQTQSHQPGLSCGVHSAGAEPRERTPNTPEEQQNSQLLPARPKGVPGNVAARATAKPAPPAPKQSPEEWESSFCPSPPNKATPRFCGAKTQLRPSPKHQLCSGKARNELTEVVEQGRTGITALACGASPHLPGVFLGTFTFPAPRQIFPALRVKGLAELPCPGQQGWLLCYLFLDKHCHSRDIPGVSKGPWAQLLCPIATAASHRAIKGFYTFLNGEREKSKKRTPPLQIFDGVGTSGVRRKFGYHQLNSPVWLWLLGYKEPQTRPQDLPNFPCWRAETQAAANPRRFSSDLLSNPSQSRNDKEATGKGHTNISLPAEPRASSFPCIPSLGRLPLK